MKHLQKKIRALLLLGADPHRFVQEALDPPDRSHTAMHREIAAAVREDAVAYAAAAVRKSQAKAGLGAQDGEPDGPQE